MAFMELMKRKKEQAFKEFEHQAISKGAYHIPSKQDLASRFGVHYMTIIKWYQEWKSKKIERR